MLCLLQSRRTLRLTGAGRLLPWLGPALRGLVARRFKAAVCRFSPHEQDTTWRYCKGCPHMPLCPYGQTLEADPPQPDLAFSGQEDGVRPIVIAPAFPLPAEGRPGLAIPVTATFIGATAAANAPRFWDVLEAAGCAPDGGLGTDRIGFRLDPNDALANRLLLDLPRSPDALAGVLPAVRVELTGPLLLRQGAREGQRRRMLIEPSFADLFRATLRTVGALCRALGQPADADFRALREAAEPVPTISHDLRVFHQGRHSDRGGHHGVVRGVVGHAVFGPVPAALARWLVAGGMVHVGLHRVAGAGGWRTDWDRENA